MSAPGYSPEQLAQVEAYFAGLSAAETADLVGRIEAARAALRQAQGAVRSVSLSNRRSAQGAADGPGPVLAMGLAGLADLVEGRLRNAECGMRNAE